MAKKRNSGFEELVKIMDVLRSDNGCPWDKVQTLPDLKTYLLEETYEVIEAIDSGEAEKIKEELGDLLFQVIFVAKLFKEKEKFDVYQVANSIKEKLIRRHPHVFDKMNLSTPKEVLVNWERIKQNEVPAAQQKKHLLDSVLENMPALMQSYKISMKAALTGFDWNSVEEVWNKVMEEVEEFKKCSQEDSPVHQAELENEMGDILFTMVNVARFFKIDPELALRKTNKKFIRRFNLVEDELIKKNKKFSEVDIQYLEKLWQKAKKKIG